MIASSTTMPIAMVSASRVKLLIEKPRKYMIAKVATIDAGIASPGMIVARMFRKKTKMISTTRMAAMSNVSLASSIECVTNTEPSNAFSSFTPVGSVCWMPGSSARMRLATSIRLAFDCRTTPIAPDGVPFQRKIEREGHAVGRDRRGAAIEGQSDRRRQAHSRGAPRHPADAAGRREAREGVRRLGVRHALDRRRETHAAHRRHPGRADHLRLFA